MRARREKNPTTSLYDIYRKEICIYMMNTNMVTLTISKHFLTKKILIIQLLEKSLSSHSVSFLISLMIHFLTLLLLNFENKKNVLFTLC